MISLSNASVRFCFIFTIHVWRVLHVLYVFKQPIAPSSSVMIHRAYVVSAA